MKHRVRSLRRCVPLLALSLLLLGCRAKDWKVEVLSSRLDPFLNIPVDSELAFSTFNVLDPGYVLADRERDLANAKGAGVPLVVQIRVNPAIYLSASASGLELTFVDEKGKELALAPEVELFTIRECIALRFPQSTDPEERKWVRLNRTPLGDPPLEGKGNVELLFLKPKELDAKWAVLRFVTANPDPKKLFERQIVGPFPINKSKGWLGWR
jgi:hypothetical protein